MVYVDFSNAELRSYFAEQYLKLHGERLKSVCDLLPSWRDTALATGRPLAAVLDIDEVLLCNIHENSDEMSGFYVADYFTKSDGLPWPRSETWLAPALPGAHELCRTIRLLGITPFLVTGRAESIRNQTVQSLEHVNLIDALAPEGRLIMCPDALLQLGEPIREWKTQQRAEIEMTHQIVVNIGDQESDLGSYGDHQVRCHHPFYVTL